MHATPPVTGTPVNDTRALRDAFSRFATGVTVVTTMTPAGPVGMTVNSFSSVSLEPPLCLWSIEGTSTRYHEFAGATQTAIHVLAHDQKALCLAFAERPDAFDLSSWRQGANGLPLIEGCLARFECQRFAAHEAGDHTILIDRIVAAEMHGGEPLIFNQGDFGRFAAS